MIYPVSSWDSDSEMDDSSNSGLPHVHMLDTSSEADSDMLDSVGYEGPTLQRGCIPKPPPRSITSPALSKLTVILSSPISSSTNVPDTLLALKAASINVPNTSNAENIPGDGGHVRLFHFGQLGPGLSLARGARFNPTAGPGPQMSCEQYLVSLQVEMARLQQLNTHMNMDKTTSTSANIARSSGGIPLPTQPSSPAQTVASTTGVILGAAQSIVAEGTSPATPAIPGATAIHHSSGGGPPGGESSLVLGVEDVGGDDSQGNAAHIEVIRKLKGEAGSRRRGYNLQQAMKMDDDKVYNTFLQSVRFSAVRAGIKYDRSYRQQDIEVVNNVCKLLAKNNSYLTTKRFPRYWPITEVLKQNLNNTRSYQNHNS
ncbi:hypothetical protein PM082_013822 [Marasmius tenuissimus]|nr:hypothetical protein PM082_013822 [Marasmius tenuissimus]